MNQDRELTILLGSDHPIYGEYELRTQRGGHTVCALSVGADPLSFGRLFKGDHRVPNEDALLAIDDGDQTLLAVADAHYGHQSSHIILQRLAHIATPLPANALALFEALRSCTDPDPAAAYESESTLAVAVWDRSSGEGFGVSYGDSSLVIVSAQHPPRRPTRGRHTFVTPRRAESLDPRRGQEFAFSAGEGDLVVAFTDGIDECSYRHPEQSVQAGDLQDVFLRCAGEPEAFVRGVTELALAGVGGHPGGQDNLAIITARA